MRFELSRIARGCTAACMLVLLASAAGIAQAQNTGGRVQAVPQRPAPPAPAPIAAPVLPVIGAPSASGLASPFAPAVPVPGVPGTSAVGTAPPGDMPDLAGDGSSVTLPDTTILGGAPYVTGAGPYGTRGIARAPVSTAPPNVVDVARSFLMADGNRDGELTRAEAMRLSIMPLSFEEMDANHDDILTRSEYEEAVR